MDVIDATGDDPLIDAAARIWAEATAARDGRDEVPALEDSRPVIQGVLDRSPRAFVLIARTADGMAAGFAAIEPLTGGDEAVAQVSYVGVRPELWGQGVGQVLLAETRRRLTAAGYVRAELFVYLDNRRATALYRREGWRPIGQPAPHPRTGRPEQRYELRLR